MHKRIFKSVSKLFGIILEVLLLSLYLINVSTLYSSMGIDIINPVELSYTLDYDIQTPSSQSSDRINFKLHIEGTQGLYENGTIDYGFNKNITDLAVLSTLGVFFSPNQLDYFQNHSQSQTYRTSFSFRRETFNATLTDFVKNTSYTIFWINTSNHMFNYLKPLTIIPYLLVENPIQLAISKNMPILIEGSWSSDPQELAKPKRIISSFFLMINYQNNIRVNFYYDQVHSILLRAQFDYIMESSGETEEYHINILLTSTNLILDFKSENPYWQTRLRWIIFGSIGGVILVGGGITAGLYIKSHKIIKLSRPKSSVLDRI